MTDIISSDLSADLKNSWRTDPRVFRALNKEFNFSMDAAASNENTLVPHCYLTIDDDGLHQDWNEKMAGCVNRNVFVNPPYSRGMIAKFMEKACVERLKGITTVMLVPNTLDAQWLPVHHIYEIRIIVGGRLSFYHPIKNEKISGNTKGSMIVIFSPYKMPCSLKMIDRNELLGNGEIDEH